MSSSIPKRIHSSMQFGKGIWHMIVSWIHLVLILSTMLCVSNAVKSSYIHDIQVNSYFFKSFGVQQKNISNIYHHYYHALEDTVTTGRFFVNANEQSSLNNLTIYMNNVAIHSQQLVSVSSHEEIIFNASATGFSNNERNYFWKISNGNSLLSLLTSNPLTHSITRGLLLKVNTNDLLPSIPYNFDFIGEYNSSNSNITMEYISFSFSVERLPKSNVIAQINGGLYEEYLPIYSYNTRSNLYPKESDFGSIIQSDGSLQLFSTSYDPENLPLVDFVKESFIWSCFYIKGHSYKLSGKSQLKSDISSSVLLPCTFETPVNTFESNYNIPTENLEYFNTYVICLDYSVGSRSDTTFIILRTLNANEYWAVRIFPSIDTTFMDPTKAIVLSGEIFPGGVLLSGVTSLKWEWTVSYLGREDQQETPTIVKTSSNSVLYLEPRTLLSNEKAYSSSPNIYEFSVKAIINQIYIVNSTFRRKVASKQQDSIIDSSSISIYPLLDGFNRPLLDKFVIEFPGITSSSVSAIYEIYYSIEGDTMKLLTTSTHMNKLTTWLPYSHTNQVDIHIFLQINDPSKESYNFRYWIGTRNIKLNNTSTDHNYLKATKSKIQNIQQQVIDILPNITDLMKKNNVTVFEPKIIQDIYLDLDKLCTTLNEYAAFNNSDEEGIIREQIASAAISAREQLKTLNSSNTFALSLFDLFRMDINLIQLISSLTKKPSHLSSRSISLIVDSLLHPLLVNFLKERNLFITRTIDVIDMRPTSEVNNPKVEFSSLFSTYSNSFLTILDSLLSTANANTIIVKSQVLAGFCQKWIHQLSIRLLEESAPSTAVTITNNNVEISYKRDLLSSLIGAGFGEGASVSVDYSNDTREWKVNNNLLLIQLPPEIRQQSLFISDIELNSDEIIHSNTERSTLANSLDASIISPLPLNITDQFVGFKIVTFKNTEGNSKILGNVMISVELLYNQQSLKLRNLKSPIEMVFFADQSVYLPTYLWMGGGCHFWNETTEEWSKEGCTTVASYSFLGNSKPKDSLITDDSNPGLNRIYCSCNHTTLFAVLKANTSDVELIQDFTNKVWGDITSCILILIFSVGQAIFLLSIRTPHNISLKFRGFIPFFGILVLILEALINLTRDGMIMNIFLTGVEIPFMDTIDGALRTVIDPLYCAMLVLYMLNIWQYYHKERFQFLMKKYQEKDEKYSIRRYVKFTSRSYLVMPCLTLYAAQLVTYIILLVLASVSVLNFKLVFTVFSLIRACLITLSVIVSFSIIIFMEIFMKKMLNFNDVKTDNFLKFEGTFNGDVFLFKIEWIAYMFMASLLVLAEGYDVMNVMYPNLYSNTFNEGSLAFQLYSRQAHIHMLEIAPIILLFMVKLLILLVYGGFVACMTARKHTFCCTRGSETQNTSDSELLDVVNDPVLGPLFEFYAMKEFTLPLVYLYRQLIDIYSFEGNFHHSMFERSQHVRKIYKRFLKKYSPFPLSISRKTMRMFHIRKEQDEAITAQELEDLITILKVETTEQLMGVYWRFKQTETFKKNEKKSVVNPYLNEDL